MTSPTAASAHLSHAPWEAGTRLTIGVAVLLWAMALLWAGCGVAPSPVLYDGGVATVDGGTELLSTCTCDAGHCLPDGSCGECASDAHCPATASTCDAVTHRCVACTPGAAHDSCPANTFCATGGTCVRGCKAASECLSGECLPTHDCAGCENDAECSRDMRCGSGTCRPACSVRQDCGAGLTCCDAHCVDTTFDVENCGMCNQACTAGAFCGRSACHDTVLANVCALPSTSPVLDGIAVDDAASVAMATKLSTTCAPPMALQAMDGGVNPTTGRPRSTGTLLTVGGGSFGHALVGWIDRGRIAPIFDISADLTYALSLGDGGTVLSVDLSTLTLSHDYFLVEIVRAPNGATSLIASGFFGAGTQAGAWWFNNKLMCAPASYGDAWYVVEWTDTNTDFVADGNDTWRVVASGR